MKVSSFLTFFSRITSDLNFSEIFTFSDDLIESFTKFLKAPLKVTNSDLGLNGKLNWKRFIDSKDLLRLHPSEVLDGYRLIFHDPFELPSPNSPTFLTLAHYFVEYLIVPRMTTVDDSILDYTPDELVLMTVLICI